MAGLQQCVSVVPQVIDALVALTAAPLAALTPPASVYDGEGASDDPGNALLVGVEDADGDDVALSATTSQSWANAGQDTPRDETGAITCVAVGWNGGSGNADQKAARDAAYAIAAVVSKTIAGNRTLGLGDWLYGCQFGVSTRLEQLSSDQGVLALLVFDVQFAARIYPPA